MHSKTFLKFHKVMGRGHIPLYHLARPTPLALFFLCSDLSGVTSNSYSYLLEWTFYFQVKLSRYIFQTSTVFLLRNSVADVVRQIFLIQNIPLGFIIYSYSGDMDCVPPLQSVLYWGETLSKDAITQSTTNEITWYPNVPKVKVRNIMNLQGFYSRLLCLKTPNYYEYLSIDNWQTFSFIFIFSADILYHLYLFH